MDKTPFFSVIIPTLNEEKYLPVLLKSLAGQTYRDFEVIAVDGNSEDKTRNTFENFISKLPSSAFILSEKRNVGYQRNFGASRASGIYLVFLDADCDIDNTFLEELHLVAVKQKFPFATTWIKPDSKKTIDNLMILLGNLGQELAKGIGKPFSGGYNTIVRKEIFEKLKGFREDLIINEDHDFALRAYKKRIEVTILKEPQVVYSLRRFRSQGILPVLRKYAQGEIYNLLKGPITKEIFSYPMGGHVHNVKKKKKANILKLDKYLQGIEKLEEKITRLLSE